MHVRAAQTSRIETELGACFDSAMNSTAQITQASPTSMTAAAIRRPPTAVGSAAGYALIPVILTGHARRRPDGEDRQPLQAARLRVPLGGDLRRVPLDLRLRPHRGAAAAQR